MIYVALALIAVLLWREHMIQAERRRWEHERGVLLNRIKPETAQVIQTGTEPPMFQPPALGDSDAWWDMQETHS